MNNSQNDREWPVHGKASLGTTPNIRSSHHRSRFRHSLSSSLADEASLSDHRSQKTLHFGTDAPGLPAGRLHSETVEYICNWPLHSPPSHVRCRSNGETWLSRSPQRPFSLFELWPGRQINTPQIPEDK